MTLCSKLGSKSTKLCGKIGVRYENAQCSRTKESVDSVVPQKFAGKKEAAMRAAADQHY